jgi:uncharacterized membrane protein YjfL (UPF0719 family)
MKAWIAVTLASVASLIFLLVYRVVARLLGGPSPRNAASAVVLSGELLGLFLTSTAVVTGCVHGASLLHDLLWVAVYGGAAALLLAITGRLGVMMLLGKQLPAEIARGNLAAAVAAAAHYAATGIVISRCLYGDDLSTLGVSVAFFGLGQVSLHLCVILFRALTSYDDAEEIKGENLAAALSYGGVTVALALIVGHAAEGTFAGWLVSLRAYGVALGYALALYPVRQLVVQTFCLGLAPTLRGGGLCRGIARERNVGYAAVEAATYLAVALLLNRLA